MRAISTLFVISMTLVTFTTDALANSIPSAGITRDEMAVYLRSKGYPATESYERGNDHWILKTTIDGVNIDVYFLDCEPLKRVEERPASKATNDIRRCASLQFAASWGVNSPDLDRVNAWNRQKRFMRAYLTESQKTLWAEYDMFLAPNGSTELIDQNLSMVKVLYKSLKAHFNF